MHRELRLFGWLGAAWAMFIGVLGIMVMLSKGEPLDPVFCLCVLGLFLASIRLIHLRRWGALAVSAYSLWMIVDSLKSDLPFWSVAWIAISATLVTLTIGAWRTLRPGL